jgi:CheY-like chemotaxis protein/HPt (histidine-containing phosphotransfer) domain-containing protein
LEYDDFRVEEMLQHIIQLTEGKAIEKGLSLRLDLDPALPNFVRGDALRLSQILINFLNNAIKFTEHGGIVLRVRNCMEGGNAEEGSRCPLRFEVQDTGIGLNEDQGARLFKSFEQGDNSTTRKFGGTGLGLAISRQLATLMDGKVGVTSTQGMGSTFWLQLDLEVAAEPDYESIPSPDVEGAIRLLKGRRVLVVDDNELNLEVARGLLQDVFVRVDVAHDGAQAIAAVQQTRFDCVLMDIQMPGMDGLEATRRIRSTPDLADMVVIAMTANAGQEDRAMCLNAGMNEVVLKPVEPDVLYVTLARWMGPAHRRSEGERAARAPAVAFKLPPAEPAKDPDALPEWDDTALTRIVGNSAAAHARLLSKYQVSARDIVDNMQRCAAQAQWSQCADLAHKLKSSSRSVGAMRLGALCEALERAGRSSNGAACDALVRSVVAAYTVVDARIGA